MAAVQNLHANHLEDIQVSPRDDRKDYPLDSREGRSGIQIAIRKPGARCHPVTS